MNIDYNNYDDKNLASVYIFSYPEADDDNATKLEEELRKRGLFEWAHQKFNKLYDIFNDEWNKKINEV